MRHQVGLQLYAPKVRIAGFSIAEQQVFQQAKLIIADLFVKQIPRQFPHPIAHNAIVGTLGQLSPRLSSCLSAISLQICCGFSRLLPTNLVRIQ